MSKHKQGEDRAVDSLADLPPLSSSAVISRLKSCQKIADELTRAAISAFLTEVYQRLDTGLDEALSNQEVAEIRAAKVSFKKNRQELEDYYCGFLSEGFVKFKKRSLNTRVGMEEGDSDDSLSLVGDEDLEESIAMTALTKRADTQFAEPLWLLNHRFTVLNGGEAVTESSNPVSPVQFCEALRKTLKYLNASNVIKEHAYKVFDTALLGLVGNVIEDVNAHLKSQGILSHLRYALPAGKESESGAPSSTARVHSGVDQFASETEERSLPVDENLPAEEYQTELLGAIRGLQNQLLNTTASVSSVSVPAAKSVSLTESDLTSAIQRIQTQAHSISDSYTGEEPSAVVNINEVIKNLKELTSEDEGDIKKDELQTIDLVGMLFEYMLDDENLPDRVKALISYLHTPLLKIAFIDFSFFERPDHPARQLLDSLAEAGARWVGNDGTQQYDIYEKIKDIVQRVLTEFESDIKVITTLLMEFNGYTKNIVRRQELVEKRAMEKVQGEEKLREVKLRVNDEMRKRTHNRELPSAVLLFFLQPWSDYLSFVLLRYGDQSAKWNEALVLVDDVLWCLRPKTQDDDKARQSEMRDGILRSIQMGFDTIGFDQTKGTKLIDALTSLMKLAMQSKEAEPAPAPMREQLEKIAAEKAGTVSDDDSKMTPEEEQVIEKLRGIEFGTWFEFEGGKRLKVAWFNASTSHYMLVDQMGKRVDMMYGVDMAKQIIGGTAKIISGNSKPFFERALENIYHKLNEKAVAVKAAEESGGADHG